jgi:hypothetical protein
MMSRDQRLPGVSTEAFSGHPGLRFEPAFFWIIFSSAFNTYLQIASEMEYCSQVERPHRKNWIVLKPAPKVEINGPKGNQDNRISKLRVCCRSGRELINTSAIQTR